MTISAARTARAAGPGATMYNTVGWMGEGMGVAECSWGTASFDGAEYKLWPGVGLTGMEFLTPPLRVMLFGYGFTLVTLAMGLVALAWCLTKPR